MYIISWSIPAVPYWQHYHWQCHCERTVHTYSETTSMTKVTTQLCQLQSHFQKKKCLVDHMACAANGLLPTDSTTECRNFVWWGAIKADHTHSRLHGMHSMNKNPACGGFQHLSMVLPGTVYTVLVSLQTTIAPLEGGVANYGGSHYWWCIICLHTVQHHLIRVQQLASGQTPEQA